MSFGIFHGFIYAGSGLINSVIIHFSCHAAGAQDSESTLFELRDRISIIH